MVWQTVPSTGCAEYPAWGTTFEGTEISLPFRARIVLLGGASF
jgi:hypothetical protein